MKNISALYRLISAVLIIPALLFSGCTGSEDPEPVSAEHETQFTEEELALIEEMEETGVLFWTPEMQLLGYKNTPALSPVRFLEPSENPYPLHAAAEPIVDFEYIHDGQTRDLNYYAENMNLAGLLVVQDGEVLLEYYGFGNEPSTTWISFSVTKSVLSMLFGAAVQDGSIENMNEQVITYLPQLEGSAYDGVTIEQVLWMSSGVAWNEDYNDSESDVGQLGQINSEEELLAYMATLPRAAEPGTRFNYNTGETNLAGAILKAATDRYLTDYANEKIWRDFGMEYRASWALMGENELEHGGCCISASLRDYARIGLLALENGVNADGDRILPETWMQQSVYPGPAFEGYGYFWWLNDQSTYSASGIFGQHIFINPNDNLVIAMHGKWPEATGRELTSHRRNLIRGIVEYVQTR